MNTQQCLNSDERTLTVLRANVWAYNFIAFALLVDIMYRSLVFQEQPWDLFVLLGVSGVISAVYAARHKMVLFTRESAIVMAIGAIVAAVVGAILAMTKAM